MMQPPGDNLAAARSRSRRRCFTLLEILVVIVLLSLAMVMTAGALMTGDANATLAATARSVLDLDRRARLLTASDGALCIASVDDGSTLRLSRNHRDEQIAAIQVPRGVAVQLLDGRDQHAIDRLNFGADGRSQDYLLLVRLSVDDQTTERRRLYRVAGLTGCITTEVER